MSAQARDELVDGMRALPIGADEIPDFRGLCDVPMKRSGWQAVAVPGLVPDVVITRGTGHYHRKDRHA